MKTMKRILKDKRGIALENAILFIVIIFSLCALLTSLTLIGHLQAKLNNIQLLRDIEIEQIGEDYLASVKASEEFTQTYENYAYDISENAFTVWRKNDANKTAVLYVEAELVDGKINVLKWCNTLPEPTE